jgi:carbamoyltransferase
MYEEAFFNLINHLHEHYGLDYLTLAGGCAMNSVANGKVRRMTPFQRVYVQSAAGDAGGAIGAAFALWHKLGGDRSFVMDQAYWGPHFSSDAVRALISTHHSEIGSAGCRVQQVLDEVELCRRTATEIADGKVVGWFQGRGMGATSNRSIVCDPRRSDMDVLVLENTILVR